MGHNPWIDFQGPGLSSISVALPLKAQVIAGARNKSPRPPRRATWKKCCWKHSGSLAERAPEEAPSATGQRGKGRRSLSLLCCGEVCIDHMFVPTVLWELRHPSSSGEAQRETALRYHSRQQKPIHRISTFWLFPHLVLTASVFSQMKISKSGDAKWRTWWKRMPTGSGTGPADPRTTHQSMWSPPL